MAIPTTQERRAFLIAMYRRVGDQNADHRTTVMDFVGRDVGLGPAETDAMVELLMKSGLVTAPTKDRVIGLTDAGVATARRAEQGGPEDEADED
jgi:hypothetical protein